MFIIYSTYTHATYDLHRFYFLMISNNYNGEPIPILIHLYLLDNFNRNAVCDANDQFPGLRSIKKNFTNFNLNV